MTDLIDIVEVQETSKAEEANDWLSYVGVRLISVAQDPYGRPHYVIGRTAENTVVPWESSDDR